MVFRLTVRPRLIVSDPVDTVADGIKSVASSAIAFVAAPPRFKISPEVRPGIFRSPPGMPPPRPMIPNPVAGGLLLTVALWELWENSNRREPALASADTLKPLPEPPVVPSAAVPLPHDVTDAVCREPDWEALAASGDFQKLSHTVIEALRHIQRELADRIDREEYPPEILKWYLDTVVPQLNRILKLVSGSRESAELIDRIWPLIAVVPMFLQSQQLNTVRELVVQSPRDLSAIIDEIVARYADRILVTQIDTLGVRLAKSIDLEKFKFLLEEIIRNAAAHPHPGSRIVRITIDLSVGSIVIRSDDQQRRNSMTWDDLWRMADELDIALENNRNGNESVATLILPDGFSEPDPLQFVLGRQGDPIVFQILIDAMTPEQRLNMLQDMKWLMDRIEDQALSQGLDMLQATDGGGHYVQNLEGVAKRMELLMRMLVEDLPNAVNLAKMVDYDIEQMWLMVKDPMERFSR